MQHRGFATYQARASPVRPQNLHFWAARVLASTEDECMRVDAAMATMVEDELPIAKQIKKRWIVVGHLRVAHTM